MRLSDSNTHLARIYIYFIGTYQMCKHSGSLKQYNVRTYMILYKPFLDKDLGNTNFVNTPYYVIWLMLRKKCFNGCTQHLGELRFL